MGGHGIRVNTRFGSGARTSAARRPPGYKRGVARFFLGFLVASGLWSAAAYGLYAKGVVHFEGEDDPVVAEASPDALDDAEAEPDKKRGKRKRASRSERPRSGTRTEPSEGTQQPRDLPRGEATTGDDLDWDGERKLDLAGGEEQLSGKQIEAGFDGAMSRIRRCLVLVPAEGDVTGKLTFGMRVGSDGAPRAVNLTGPAVVTSGESGSCLRKAAEGIRFAKFSGPDMLFRYPITLQ
jgi:hypothetical protein